MVTGAAPLVETTRAEGADRIDDAAIRGLPNNGRNFLDFTKLTPGRQHRAGPGRRRADHQRPEGHRQQHLGGRRRLQQPVLRRAARRPAPALHLQPRRGQGSGGGGGGRARGVRPQQRRLRQRGHQVGDQRPPRHRARLLQERRPLVRAQAGRRHHRAQDRLQPAAGRLHPGRAAGEGQGLLLHRPRLPARRAPPSRPTPRASSSAWSTTSRAWAARTRTGPSSAPTTPACSWARSTGSSTRPTS